MVVRQPVAVARAPDAVVIGAGFGGLSAALGLADAGARVVVCETLNYPGGCASSFRRHGLRFESGATLFSGFGPGQLFDRWSTRFGLDVGWDLHDPVMTFHLDGTPREVPADRATWVTRMAQEAGPAGDRVRAFFDAIEPGSAALWALIDEDLGTVSQVARAARDLAGHARWARWVGRSLHDVAHHHGVADVQPLRAWLDAVCQITIQTHAAGAEAPFGLAATAFPFRGVASVRGGIGRFAWALAHAIEARGGEILWSNPVHGLEPRPGGGWRAATRHGPIDVPVIVANTLPQVVSTWLGRPVRPKLQEQLAAGWSAVMLYLVVADAPEFPDHATHHQVWLDPSRPAVEGNHAVITLGERQVSGDRAVRTATVSTHFRADRPAAEVPGAVQHTQDLLRSLVAHTFPSWRLLTTLPASPRTFQRFTGRPGGLVGGVPRRVGLHHYLDPLPTPVAPGLYLVGDSVFPGQSTLAAAVGGARVASAIRWPRQSVGVSAVGGGGGVIPDGA